MFLRKSILLIVLMGLGLSLALAACASSPAAVTPPPVAGTAVPATVTSTSSQATTPPATATPASTPAPAATAPALPTGQPEETASAAAIATHAQTMQAEFQRIADLARQAQALLPADEGQQPTESPVPTPTPTQRYGRLGGRVGLAAPRRPAASVRERLVQIIAWAEQGKEEAGQLAEVAQGLQDAGSAAKAKPLFARGEKMIERLGALAQQIDQAIQQMLSERPSGSEQVAALMAQARNADARILASVQVTRHALEALQRSGGNQNKATPTTP